jgi:hypothetical protein
MTSGRRSDGRRSQETGVRREDENGNEDGGWRMENEG